MGRFTLGHLALAAAVGGSVLASTGGDIMQQLAKKTMTVAPADEDFGHPWVMLRPGANDYTRLSSTGVLFDILFDSLNKLSPDDGIEFNFTDTTKDSRDRFPLEPTENLACCYEVGIGKVDVCVGDIWRLPAREARANFSPTVMDDRFYLVVARDDSEFGASFLGTPFSPFKAETWGALVGWVFGMTVVLWGLRAWSMGFAAFRNKGMRSSLTSFVRDNVQLWDDFLHGQVQVAADTLAHRWFRLGFQFFVLVLLSSYTASLTSMLTAPTPAHGKVASITEAIQMSKTICGSKQLRDTIKAIYPKVRYVDLKHSKDGPRKIYSNDCDGIVVSERYVEELHAGLLKDRDCKLLYNGTLSDEEAHCELGFDGKRRDDCVFTKVGDILFTIPVAFPVSARYVHPVSYAITQYLFSGGLEQAKRMNAYAMPPSKCTFAKHPKADDNGKGLDVDKLGGAFAISFCIIAFGILGCLVWNLVCLAQAACSEALSAAPDPPLDPVPIRRPLGRPGGIVRI